MEDVKQVIVMRTDLNCRKGKMVSQGAHASLGAVLRLMNVTMAMRHVNGKEEVVMIRELIIPNNSYLDSWLNGIFTKITVGVNSLEELEKLYSQAQEAGLPCVKITDAGKTEFNGVPTITCIAIGPYWSSEIDKITGELKLL